MQKPFYMDAQRAQRMHGSFALSALTVGVSRVVDGKLAITPVSKDPQVCNKVAQATPELPREKHRLPCPHCEQPAVIRTSVQMSRVTREYMYCCTNPECGHTFVALTEVVRTLSPSATPDPSVTLPISTHVRRDMLRAQLDNAAQAEHRTSFTRPVTGDLFNTAPPPAAPV